MNNQSSNSFFKDLNESIIKCNSKHSRGIRNQTIKSISIISQSTMITFAQLIEHLMHSYHNHDFSLQIDHYASMSMTIPKVEEYVKTQTRKILNVLVVSKILRESAGFIFNNDVIFSKNNEDKNKHFKKREEVNNMKIKLQTELARKKRENNSKLKKQTDFTNKLNNLNSLLEKNKLEKPKKFLKFPFLMVIPSNEPDSHLSIEMEKNDKKLILDSNMELSIYSDQEIINILKHAKKDKPSIIQETKESPIKIEFSKESVTQKLSHKEWQEQISIFDSSTNDKSLNGCLSSFDNFTDTNSNSL